MRLKPDYNLISIYEISSDELLQRGIKGVFFDLDSTVMKSKSGVFTKKTLEFFDKLEKNFKLAIISNNKREDYIKKACAQCKIKIYSHAKKPDTKLIFAACEEMELDPKCVAMVGDRPLTDILAGKNAKMLTILVDSISKDEENLPTRFVRWLERLTIKK